MTILLLVVIPIIVFALLIGLFHEAITGWRISRRPVVYSGMSPVAALNAVGDELATITFDWTGREATAA